MKVLYLEDEPLIALDGEAMLQELGFEDLKVATNLSKAAEISENSDIDLAILDVHVGQNINSFSLARSLRDEGVPVVFVTGYNATEFPGDLKTHPIVSKPFNKTSLAGAINSVVAGNDDMAPC